MNVLIKYVKLSFYIPLIFETILLLTIKFLEISILFVYKWNIYCIASSLLPRKLMRIISNINTIYVPFKVIKLMVMGHLIQGKNLWHNKDTVTVITSSVKIHFRIWSYRSGYSDPTCALQTQWLNIHFSHSGEGY